MKAYIATGLIRLASACIALATRLAQSTPHPPPTVLRDDMSDEAYAAMADGEILSRALKGIAG